MAEILGRAIDPDAKVQMVTKDRPFPPPTINRWVRWQTVSTKALITELRWWADQMEALANDGVTDGSE